MLHPKQHIIDLAEICSLKGVRHIIISPGSRNAPLVDAFFSRFGEACLSIVDERSAAYFALGIARCLQSPVVLICTSGTAVLNYGPALAEAYYQQIPVIAITADRPAEWIDQLDNQTIRQQGIFNNFIKKDYQLPQVISNEDGLWFSQRLVSEAINTCTRLPMGPVHLNVPLEEPLYASLPGPSDKIKIIDELIHGNQIALPGKLVLQWQKSEKILIVHGQDIPCKGLNDALAILSRDPRVVIVAENLSNLNGDFILRNPDLLFTSVDGYNNDYPDLLIYSGGQIVSKKLKTFLRKAGNIVNWRINREEYTVDTFKNLTSLIPFSSEEIYNALAQIRCENKESSYQKNWLKIGAEALKRRDEITSSAKFSDLKAFKMINDSLPENSVVELGNSSVIRYSQFFDVKNQLVYYSNRGVSGIDGCLSTAAGTAHASGKLTIAIAGDLSFLYDSNALWNQALPVNLKIIVINNSGGNIFHLIEGPSAKPGFKKLIEAHHPVKINKLAEAFGLDYFFAGNEIELLEKLPLLYAGKSKPAILEIKTETGINLETFKRIMGKKE
jgi:2-succinyl-5-enolpyruvyl-6-hydroxy-3-cyclohexene-1-carboxylate synthase